MMCPESVLQLWFFRIVALIDGKYVVLSGKTLGMYQPRPLSLLIPVVRYFRIIFTNSLPWSIFILATPICTPVPTPCVNHPQCLPDTGPSGYTLAPHTTPPHPPPHWRRIWDIPTPLRLLILLFPTDSSSYNYPPYYPPYSVAYPLGGLTSIDPMITVKFLGGALYPTWCQAWKCPLMVYFPVSVTHGTFLPSYVNNHCCIATWIPLVSGMWLVSEMVQASWNWFRHVFFLMMRARRRLSS